MPVEDSGGVAKGGDVGGGEMVSGGDSEITGVVAGFDLQTNKGDIKQLQGVSNGAKNGDIKASTGDATGRKVS